MRLSESQPEEREDITLNEANNSLTISIEDKSEQTTENNGFLPILQNSRFLILWGGQIFSQLADKVYLVMAIAIIASTFQIPGEPISLWVSPVTIAFTIPAVLFGSLAGVYVDRWSKKAVLVFSNLFRGILLLILPFLLWLADGKAILSNLSWGFATLLGITFLVSTLTQFFAPAEQAVIPLIVKKQDLLAANSLYTTTMMALLIIGFAVGEPLLDIADSLVGSWGFPQNIGKEVLVGSAYAVAGIILIALQTKETKKDQSQTESHPLQDIWEGVQYLGKNNKVRNALIQLIVLFSVFAALVVLAVSMADKIPQLDADEFGILLATTGLGMGVSAAIVGNLGQRFTNAQLSFVGSIGVALSLVGLSQATQNLWLALAMTALMGAFAALIGIPMQTTIQSQTPPDMRGKVFGLQNNVVNIALSLPLVLAAEAEAHFGLESVILGLAVIVLIGGMFTWYLALRNTTVKQ
ncbi:Arabinose efflux permease family protein [Hyella patelloides LEGE 07179]|uniref:Arabinose efflux permease family protein n=1 Tax=Hyella patelloides LEGE 07179 TaxID=945734 RepID=A0A563VQ47_9CYAN|nr:MFS transporter [Hyella patelloides]VEP13509.1 Arabinose efflux permease family protein [Hyella patelloides LEGE 07179]